jgi:uncharacterized protein (DUF983 family)
MAVFEITTPVQPRSRRRALWRGFAGRCPACGRGSLFARFLKIADRCPSCGEELHHHRADDAPPYFTMFIAGHIVIPAVLLAEKWWAPPLAVHFALWLPLTLALTFVLMPRVKGAIVGLQWALKMHGFEQAAHRAGPRDAGESLKPGAHQHAEGEEAGVDQQHEADLVQ